MSYNARYQDIDDYEEEKDSSIILILGTIAKWFIRIGMVCAVIVAIYYLVKLQIVNLLLFIIGLIIFDKKKLEKMKYASEIFLKIKKEYSVFSPILAVAVVSGGNYQIDDWLPLI